MTLLQRVVAPKSQFFRRVQVISFFLAFFCLAVLLLPFQKPELVQQTAGYLYAAATAAALVCQVTADGRKSKISAHGKPLAKRK